ncbi:MAG: hypothetical protein IT458_19570, partial [Planctomycetes bacterium]|nr:hypothetical protein [Planctomycetota bacterium]
LRPARQVRFQRDGDTVKPTAFQPPLSDAEARTFVDQIVALRGDRALTLDEQRAGGEGAPRAFDGWEDLVKRVFRPRFAEAADDQAKRRLLLLYSALLNGKDGGVEMGTAPLTFASGNAVAYRAAAARRRIAGQEVGRLELSGVAAVMPGAALQRLFHTQEGLEEAFRLDRRAPYFQTFPINVAAILPNDLGTDPASRHFAHLVPEAFPQMGMGAARFPARDPLGAALRPAPSSTPYGGQLRTHQAMTVALDPEGRDVVQEGPYELENSGPAPGAGAGGPQGPQAGGAARNRFPFSGRGGYVARHAVSFWFKLKDLGDQALYDLSATEPDRNRIRLLVQNREVVFEVLDEAGVDPDPSLSKTQVERSAARWRVPVDQARLQPDVWYHVSLSAEGTRPGQITLLLDGVPRSQPDLRTFLTAPIPAYKEQNSGRPFYDEPLLHPKIQVESTEGFPEQGVLRVGLELFEYTSKTPSTFECKYVDSFGGRVARMGLFEYRPDLPVDASGRPTRNAEDLVRGQNLDVTPEHPSGAAVELYGYSLPIYRDTILNPGSARLTGEIQAFAIARAYVSNAKTITVAGQRSSITLGRGLPANASENPDIELGDPVVPAANASYPPAQAPDRIAGAFSTTGGFALLVQYADERNYQPDPTTTAAFAFGGIEVIRYTSRQGNKLSGVTRAAQLPGQQVTVRGLYDGQPRTFIFDYDKSITVGRTPARDLIQYQCYVVPISLPVQGQVTDPTTLGYVEWLQIYPGPGDAENDTEWVRYDLLVDRQHVVRTQPSAWFSVFRAITSRGGANSGQPIGPGGGSLTPGDEGQLDYGQPRGDGVRRIGYLDPIEDVGRNGYPIVNVTRNALGFRGDPFTGTTSHTQRANAMVLPVHRMELDWGNYGALTGRAGRHDRIGLVGGLATASGSRAALEWHTVNWTARRYGSDNPQQGQQRGAVQRLGRYPFQLVGFKDPLRTLYTGPTDRNDLADVRAVDRIVKFPSGELPAAYVDLAMFGATRQQDVNPSRAVIDEIDLVRHRHPPISAPLAAILDQTLSDAGTEILVRADLGVSPVGPVAAGNVLATIPPTGGLLRIDDEILAYSEYQSGRFTVARSGRGLLGTQPRAHAEGAMVFFLDQVPAAILAEGASETGATLQLQALGELSPFSGTVLLKTELLHYTWTRAGRILEMPRWSDPERPDTQGRGLFRGRYGTLPVSALGGEPVIAFPFRYWDRHHERADDPEQAYVQLSPRNSPVYYTGITWEEELPDPLVDLHCYVRVDERSRFDQEPGVAPGLYLFRDPLANGRPNPIGWQGSRLEARFVHVYRPGAFDPITFQGQAWKRAPTVKSVRIGYEGGSRILEERVTAR